MASPLIVRLIDDKPIERWIDICAHYDQKHHSHDDTLYKLFKTIVENTAWHDEPVLRHEIDRLAERLGHSKHVKHEFRKELARYHSLQQMHAAAAANPVPPPRQHAHFYTCRVTDRHLQEKIQQIAGTWKRLAKTKEALAFQLGMNDRGIDLDDSKFICKVLRHDLKAPLNDREELYVAYDTAMKVQAMGLTCYDPEDQHYHLAWLATHPDNIVVHNTEAAVTGAATAVLKHIAFDMQKNDRSSGRALHLYALEGAEGFYRRLGFTGNGRDLRLAADSMAPFVAAHATVGEIRKHDSNAGELH